jgi:hypothetical protein
MDSDEQFICEFLKFWRGQFVGQREIARRAAGKRKYQEDPGWAKRALARLVEKGIVETDTTGHFRLYFQEKKKQSKKWIAPDIRNILAASGKDFAGVFEIDEEAEVCNNA